MEDKITIKLPTDMDMFIEYECPFCKRKYRLKTNEYNNEEKDELMCVYCGLTSSKNNFMPKAVERFIQDTAARYMQEEIDKQFSKFNMKSGIITMKYKAGKKIEPETVHLDEGISNIIVCSICKREIKVDEDGLIKHYCPYCEEIF